MLKYNKKLKKTARNLRKNMTEAERKLWRELRRDQINGYRFYRQKPIGNYIVDFYCPKLKLIIELDGSQHYWKKGIKNDQIRDSFLRSLGLKIIHIPNVEVYKNLEGIVEAIWQISKKN